MHNRLFEPILDIVYETMPRDNLLNSACLEFFEFIKRVRNDTNNLDIANNRSGKHQALNHPLR
jgi:hypothetical protein